MKRKKREEGNDGREKGWAWRGGIEKEMERKDMMMMTKKEHIIQTRLKMISC